MTSLTDLADSIRRGVEELAEENRRLRERVEATEKVVEAAKKMREAAAHMAMIIVRAGLTKELDPKYNGFGKRMDAALRALEEGK